MMKAHQCFFSFCLFAALAASGTGVSHAQDSTTRSGLDKIGVYAGHWKTATVHYTTSYSKAGKETGTLQNLCWRSGDFYACHQVVNGKSAALVVFTYDAKHDLYYSHAVPANGDPAYSGKLLIKGNIWTFPWEYADKGKTIYFRVLNIWHSQNRIEYRQEYSPDNIHWTLMAKGQTIRQEGG